MMPLLRTKFLPVKGPFVLKPKNDFSELESLGLEISLAKPILIPANLHKVTGILRVPVKKKSVDGSLIAEEYIFWMN